MDVSGTVFQNTGSVLLVGAGCEAGQITLRGLKAIQEADVIVYDDLLDKALLMYARADCELVEAGKRCSSHKKQQEETQELLACEARKGKKVVRLKGGDPTVFGRGGEEYLAMREAGIPCEMIPGVSSCIAAPEHMGISITQRGMASSFTAVTAYGAQETAEDYRTLAALKGTLVFLMGLTRAGEIAEGLIGAGKDPMTPASILSCVFRTNERRLDGTLVDLPEMAKDAQMPSIIVIGETASLHMLDGVKEAPKTAVVAGTASFTGKMAGLLRQDGIRAVEYPCVRLLPQLEEIPPLEEIKQYDWAVFTSANGVRIFAEKMREMIRDTGKGTNNGSRIADLRSLAHLAFACIGPGTAQALEDALLIRADLVPEEYTTEALGEALLRAVKPGQKVLVLRAAEGNPALTKTLERENVPYRDCRIYRTQYFDPGKAAEGADFVLFGSAGSVRAFLKQQPIPEKAVPVCIGKRTKAELEALTGRDALTAEECTAEGIRKALTAEECTAEGIRKALTAEECTAEGIRKALLKTECTAEGIRKALLETG